MESVQQPVDVICVYTAGGEVRPLRVKLKTEDDTCCVDIHQILGVEKNLCFGAEAITFLCRGPVADRSRLFELRYSVRSLSWWLTRMFC